MILLENHHLIYSNREKCADLIKKFRASGIDETDLIDFFISLHIVLEVSINSLFRYIYRAQTEVWIEKISISSMDKINFRDKVITFIYGSEFIFSTEEEKEEAREYSRIIGHIGNFCSIRNNLLHGHSIATEFSSAENPLHTKTREKINPKNLVDHVKNFIKIIKGIEFFYNHWHPPSSPPLKESNIEEFLDVHFLDEYEKIN